LESDDFQDQGGEQRIKLGMILEHCKDGRWMELACIVSSGGLWYCSTHITKLHASWLQNILVALSYQQQNPNCFQ
jgi:hypothetical protein